MVLVRSDLRDVIVSLHLSRAVFHRIRMNFVWALRWAFFSWPCAVVCVRLCAFLVARLWRLTRPLLLVDHKAGVNIYSIYRLKEPSSRSVHDAYVICFAFFLLQMVRRREFFYACRLLKPFLRLFSGGAARAKLKKRPLVQLQRGGSAVSRRRTEAAAGPRSYPRLGRPVHGLVVKLRSAEQSRTKALHTARRADRARVGGERTARQPFIQNCCRHSITIAAAPPPTIFTGPLNHCWPPQHKFQTFSVAGPLRSIGPRVLYRFLPCLQ